MTDKTTNDTRPRIPGRTAGLALGALLLALLAGCAHRLPDPAQARIATAQALLDRHPLYSPLRGAAPLPLFEAVHGRPLEAAYRAGLIEAAVRSELDDVHGLLTLGFNLAGIALHRPASAAELHTDVHLQAADPLASALAALNAAGPPASAPQPTPAATYAELPTGLREQLSRLIATLAHAEGYRRRAFAALPADLSPARLIDQAVDGELGPLANPDFRVWVPQVEYTALAVGMLDLAAATRTLATYLQAQTELPALRWEAHTALGRILIDTTGTDAEHSLSGTLLLVDTAGNDRYRAPALPQAGIRVLIDLAGDDCYQGATGAVLGYSLLVDLAGDDRHGACGPEADDTPPRLSQAAALFGAALLEDAAGDDHYQATSHAQGWALAGLALLVERGGQDHYQALSFAQGSAGTHAVGLLIDASGNDRYILAAEPLIHPSAQLPGRNLSMGQGAATGLRAVFSDGRSLPGGLGGLIDLAGDDRYQAEVFAQGAGYYQGTGVLIDGGGADDYHAAWYGMAAAAHQGTGILIDRGNGNDRYQASHATSLAAAHDRSVVALIDEGGDDHYRLGHLGLGAAHDNGVALFADLGGADHYEIDATDCLAFGATHLNAWGTLRESLPNLALFLDLGGADRYPANCPAANERDWQSPSLWPDPDLPSQHGRGLDGEHASPLHTGPRTRRIPRDN